MATLDRPLTPSSALSSQLTGNINGDKKGVSQSRNPVSLRLYKVLSTNFDDEDTQQALGTLSDLYVTPKSKDALVVVEDVDDEVFCDSTDGLSVLAEAVPGESTAKARKYLWKDMESRLAEGSRKFLEALGEVDSKLCELQTHVAAMKGSCDEAEKQLALMNESSKMLLERAGNLRDERQEIEDKKTIIALFLARFTLDEAEVEALASRDIPIGQQFFDAMDKTEHIRGDCRVLMAGEGGSTRAGLEIMASTSSNLEKGYEKLFRYCSNEFRHIGGDSQLEVNHDLRESVVRLRKRPELLTEALTFLSETRQATLLSSFMTALTRGGPSGYPRPIELHAHDPLRYIGDMLAWVHQSIAAEREFLESLFGLKSDGRMVGSIRKFDSTDEEEDWIRELMDLTFGKLCIPLKVRVQQTIRSQESSIVSYKIANLLQFYLVTIQRTIGEALLSTTLKETTDLAYKLFYESIEAQSRALSRIPLDHDDRSVKPPLAVLDHAQILREVMSVYQSSMVGDEDEDEREAGFRQVLDIMVTPVSSMCISNSAQKKTVRPGWDDKAFVLNCLCYLQSVLAPFNFTAKKQAELQIMIDEWVILLTNAHSIDITREAGLFAVANTCENHNNANGPLSRHHSTNPAALQHSLHVFSIWLSSLEVVHSPRLAQLAVPKLQSSIHHDALVRLAKTYQMICEEVKKPENMYEAASTLLGSERPFGQVHLLWQIFGLEEDGVETDSGDEEEEDDGEEESEESEGKDTDEVETEDDEDEDDDASSES